MRGYRELDRIRVTSQIPDSEPETTIQVTVRAAPSGRTTLGFHQERLAVPGERERQRAHWAGVLDRIQERLDEP